MRLDAVRNMLGQSLAIAQIAITQLQPSRDSAGAVLRLVTVCADRGESVYICYRDR